MDLPPRDPDYTSPEAEMRRVAMVVAEWARDVQRYGDGLDGVWCVDAAAAMLRRKIEEHPDEAVEVLAWCWLVAARVWLGREA